MLARYQSKEIAAVFSDQNRFALFLEIEALLLEGLCARFKISRKEIAKLRALKSRIEVEAIEQEEARTRHDITAFLSWIFKKLPHATGIQQFLHFGLTSSDLVDTALAVQMRQALALVLKEQKACLKILSLLARRYKGVAIVGRTHGIHAEITSLGLKFLGFWSEGRRNARRLELAVEEISFGKLSGSVGTFGSSVLSPKEEKAILKKLGLNAEPVATQVVPRDRHAMVMAHLAILAAWIERIATEIRHLQRTEVGELSEPFKEGEQQGSSSMPHKRNPVLCENLCGLARMMRGYTLASLENIALWHERDISHSSAERIALPDAFHLAHFMLKRLNQVLCGLKVHRARLEENRKKLLDLTASQRYLNALIAAGMPRAEAYQAIQKASFAAIETKTGLYEELKKIKGLPKNLKLKRLKPHDFLKAESEIFKRTLKN